MAALPLLAYGAAILAYGNGFVAAFVAGVFFAKEIRELPDDAVHLAEDVGVLLSVVVWFVFGALIKEVVAQGISWNVVLYALLATTVVRMVPVALSLLGSGMPWRDALFVGWLGPRGLASIVFGLLALIQLDIPRPTT